MKHLLSATSFFILTTLFSSCVGTKKFKALESEKQKLEATLSTTKEELSDAKRQLNKLKDASSSSNEELAETISGLKQQLEEGQNALDAAQSAMVNCQNKLQQAENQIKNNENELKGSLAPLLELQKNLTQQNKSLQYIQEDITTLLTTSPEIIATQVLSKDELILTFDDKYLFAASGHTLSAAGREGLFKLAEVLKKHPSVYIDVNAHVYSDDDSKDNWKNSTRKTLSVIYTLTQKEVLPNRMRGIAYGEYAPLVGEENPDYKNINNRTEVILHYQNTQLLKSIPLK